MTSQIREHMTVIASCGKQVGTIDHVEGKSLKLTRKDNPNDSGEHEYLPMSAVASIKGDEVHLNINSEEAKSAVTRSAQ
ncbi:DUF2171 domain-containing protein [Roseomonas terrae]|uniref:DUF2171 domain-containing protein n=1 Tax=Neoroseomonas terrae TaxID=424799 RepID=A0ABS5EM35_9PROT|nr:DUF2171 domain-containing protein [Neoroseomonas terrae]MBR0652094.1 DUF2171 domain-containing protein [Neoroseomonas terrae]